MARPCRPSCSPICFQTAGSNPSVVSISRRTSDSGDLSSKKRRTDLRSSSCSSLKAKFTATTPLQLRTAGGRNVRDHAVKQRVRCQNRPMPLGTLDIDDNQAEVHKVSVGPMDNNVYIVRCKQTGDSVLIDAANEHERLLDLCKTLNVRRVLETHGHWDHIQAVPAVRDAGIDVGITAEDADMLPSYDSILEDESVIEVGRLRLVTIATPGHTPGS